VGKFESIHRGHRRLIQTVTELAKRYGLASAIVAFTPHPYRVLGLGNGDYKPLLTGRERVSVLAELGADILLEYPFDEDLIKTSAAGFGKILFDDLNASVAVVGEGYRFGFNREGTANDLTVLARRYGKATVVAGDLENISTSAIRGYLDQNRLDEAAGLLGFPYFAMGVVASGRRLGHKLGFPTLNLYPPPDKYLPSFGVYATQTHIAGRVFTSITNVGMRPTVNADETVPTIETHVFDFDEDAYGREIRVDFLRFVRAEKKFADLDALRAQIGEDIKAIKR
jgi:riboflavin kinase/FMN adenylyltransferase